MNYIELLFNDKIIASVIFILMILQQGMSGFLYKVIGYLIVILFIWYFYLLWRNRNGS